MQFVPDDKSVSQENSISNIWSPHQTFPWRSVFTKNQTTILAHKVTHHDLSTPSQTPSQAANVFSAPIRVMDVTSLLSTVQPWLKPNDVAPAKEDSLNKPSSPNSTEIKIIEKPVITEIIEIKAKETQSIADTTTTTNAPVDDDCPPGLHGIFDKQSIKCKRSAGNANNPFGLQPFPDFTPPDSSAERAVKMQKDIQRLMHFVTVVGHVDSFLTKRFRSGLKKMAKLYDSEEITPPQRPRRRIKF